MEGVNKNLLNRKSLKVAVKEPIKEPDYSEDEKQQSEIQPQLTNIAKDDTSLEASKVKLTKKGKPDSRGKNEQTISNLAKGRAKLAETWAEKKRIKEELEKAALEKKVNQALKQKQLINKSYGVESEEEEDEEDDEPIVEQLTKKQILKKAPKAVPIAKAEKVKQEPKPKKKVIKYVEVESSSEEEEIVYVKKSKKQSQQQYVPQQQQLPQQQIPQKPNITFW